MSTRRFRRTKKTFNKMNFNNKAQSKQLAKNTKAINMLKHDSELKDHTTFRALGASVVGSQDFVLNAMQQGITGSTRVGDVISQKFLQLNLLIQATGLTLYRIMIYVDRQNDNKSLPVPLPTFFEHFATNAQAIVSSYNHDNVGKGKRIRILWDSGPQIMTNTQGIIGRTHRKNLRLGYKTHYSSNVGSSVDIVDHKISLVYISNDTSTIWNYSSALRYTDS